MLTPIAMMLLTAYSAVLVVSYFVVRLGWMRAYPMFVISFVVNALVLFSFSLSRGNSLLQAIIVGLSMALVFDGLSVTIGMMFRTQVPLPKQVRVEKPKLDAVHQPAA